MNTQSNADIEAAMRWQTLDGLAVFCALQRSDFDPEDWMRRSACDDSMRVAFAAHYLSMTDWYGHEEELEAIAEKIYPGIVNVDTYWQEMQAIDLALARLPSAIRFGLTRANGTSLPASGESSAVAPQQLSNF
ncbi:MAG: hypothetical protein ABI040_08910 [Rhodoferax sp.]